MAGYGTTGWKHTGKVIDWGNVSVEGGKVADGGAYGAEVAEANPVESSKGDPMIKIRLKLTSSDDQRLQSDIDDAGERGLTCFDQWTLTQSGAFRVKNFCIEAHVEPPESVDYDEVARFCRDIVGRKVDLRIKNTTYEGRKQAKVEYYGTEPPKDEAKGNGHPTRETATRGKPASRPSARR